MDRYSKCSDKANAVALKQITPNVSALKQHTYFKWIRNVGKLS